MIIAPVTISAFDGVYKIDEIEVTIRVHSLGEEVDKAVYREWLHWEKQLPEDATYSAQWSDLGQIEEILREKDGRT